MPSSGASPAKDPRRATCPFCLVVDDGADVILEDGSVVVFPAHRRIASHRADVIVAPKEHIERLEDLPLGLYGPLLRAVVAAVSAVERAFGSRSVAALDPLARSNIAHVHFVVSPVARSDYTELVAVDDVMRAELAAMLRSVRP